MFALRIEYATKPIWHYPSHLRHVATLPWEISRSAKILKIGYELTKLQKV